MASPPGVSIDELFGREIKRCLVKQDGDNRLRHLLGIEKLDVTEKCQVLQLLDAFVERGRSTRKAQAGAAR